MVSTESTPQHTNENLVLAYIAAIRASDAGLKRAYTVAMKRVYRFSLGLALDDHRAAHKIAWSRIRALERPKTAS